MSDSDRSHCIHLRRTEQTKDDHDLILPVSLNPALKIPVTTSEPIPLRQRRPFFKANRLGMFLNLPASDIRDFDDEVFQLAQYTGTLATLESIADMYVSDPPCQKAMMHVHFICKMIEGSPNPAQIFARLCCVYFESSTGLKMADLLRALYQEPCGSYGLAQSPQEFSRGDNKQRLGWGPGWDKGLTVAKLRSVLQEHYHGMHMRVSPVVDMEIRLLDTIEGLRPIVPTAVEGRALVDQ